MRGVEVRFGGLGMLELGIEISESRSKNESMSVG